MAILQLLSHRSKSKGTRSTSLQVTILHKNRKRSPAACQSRPTNKQPRKSHLHTSGLLLPFFPHFLHFFTPAFPPRRLRLTNVAAPRPRCSLTSVFRLSPPVPTPGTLPLPLPRPLASPALSVSIIFATMTIFVIIVVTRNHPSDGSAKMPGGRKGGSITESRHEAVDEGLVDMQG